MKVSFIKYKLQKAFIAEFVILVDSCPLKGLSYFSVQEDYFCNDYKVQIDNLPPTA